MNDRDIVPSPKAAAVRAEANPLSVLVADDDKQILQLLTRYLQGLQHRVAGSANNGLDIVTLVRELQPDLVILDIDMPKMDGIEAARTILGAQEMPIIISTGSADESTLERLRNVKIGAYLVKPFSPVQLKAAIYIAMTWYRQGREAAEWKDIQQNGLRKDASAPSWAQIDL